jgi:hypothetical protein
MSVHNFLKRIIKLGLKGILCRIRERLSNCLSLWSQSLWWGWKARQKMSNAALLANTTGNWPSLEALLDHLAERPASSFVFPHESSNATALLLNHDYPEYFLAVIAAADAACRIELTLLGQVFHFPQGIDWHSDPVTSFQFPGLHRSRMSQYLGSARPVDLILFWELNRHQHFITLGIAYWLTGDEKYVDAFSSQIQSWIDTNPLQQGVNWYYPLEVSIRLIAWTAAFQFFRNSSKFREKTGKAFLKSMWQQADFLSSHLQTTRTDIPNNHMIAELTGLVIVGSAFPEFISASAWRETGLNLLAQQAIAQTHADGVNKEQATGYHRFISELLLLIVARCHQGSLPRVPDLEQTLERMLDYVLFASTPVGTAPQWGDSDYGRALGLGQNKDFWDFRPILSAGAALYDRADWKFAAGSFDEEAFWLLGSEGKRLWLQIDACPPRQTSRAFPQAGQYIIRDSWTTNTDAAFFRCGPFGLGGEGHCAHAHADLLSFSLWVNGQPLLVDSGTYTYHGPLRDYFRLTEAHNTVKIDGNDQAIPKPNFNWINVPEAKSTDWTGKAVKGVMVSPNGVKFIRHLSHPRPDLWQVTDKLTGMNDHQFEWCFHFAPDLGLTFNNEQSSLTIQKEENSFLTLHLPKTIVHYAIKESWFSYQYGVKQANQTLYAKWNGELDYDDISFNWLFELDKKINK